MEPNQALRQAAEDIAAAEASLAAIGVLLSAAAFTVSDALRAEAKRAKAHRAEARQQAQKPPQDAR